MPRHVGANLRTFANAVSKSSFTAKLGGTARPRERDARRVAALAESIRNANVSGVSSVPEIIAVRPERSGGRSLANHPDGPFPRS